MFALWRLPRRERGHDSHAPTSCACHGILVCVCAVPEITAVTPTAFLYQPSLTVEVMGQGAQFALETTLLPTHCHAVHNTTEARTAATAITRPGANNGVGCAFVGLAAGRYQLQMSYDGVRWINASALFELSCTSEFPANIHSCVDSCVSLSCTGDRSPTQLAHPTRVQPFGAPHHPAAHGRRAGLVGG